MAFTLKPIKPKGKLFDLPKIEQAVKEAMQEVAEDAKADYERTVSSWNHKPTFEITPTKDGAIVGTEDQIYEYVDEGTRPHTIQIKNARVLRFRGGYRAKTRPGVIGSGSGGASGDFVYTNKPIQHPGTKARRFTQMVQRKAQNSLPVVVAQKLGGVLGD